MVGISIGSIAAAFAVEDQVDYARGITGLIIYAIFPIVLSYVGLISYRGRKLLDGTPTILIQNGRIIQTNLLKTKMNINDLLEECRIKGAFDIATVEYAILETSGKLSLLLRSSNQPLTPRDMNIPVQNQGLCTNLIIDGKILHEHLRCIRKDEAWLVRELQYQSVKDVKGILLAYMDTSNQLHVHRKGEEPPQSPLM